MRLSCMSVLTRLISASWGVGTKLGTVFATSKTRPDRGFAGLERETFRYLSTLVGKPGMGRPRAVEVGRLALPGKLSPVAFNRFRLSASMRCAG